MTVLHTFFDIYKCNFEINKKNSWNWVYILTRFLIFFFSWQLKTPNQLFGVSLFKWNISSCAQRSQHWRNCHFMWVFFRRAWAIGFVRVRRCPQDFKISSCLWGIWYCCFNWKEVSRCANKFSLKNSIQYFDLKVPLEWDWVNSRYSIGNLKRKHWKLKKKFFTKVKILYIEFSSKMYF